jgi:general L-amino acid transport system permease protein
MKISRAVLMDRLPGWAGQLIVLAAVVVIGYFGVATFIGNIRALKISSGFGFLDVAAGFEIAQALVPFGPASSYLDAVVVATLNTLLVVALSVILSTAIAAPIAFARLASNPMISKAAGAYVEVFRNVPLLLQIFFWYFSALALLPGVRESLSIGAILLNNRGLFLPRVHVGGAGLAGMGVTGMALFFLFLCKRRGTLSKAPSWIRVAWIFASLVPVLAVYRSFGLDLPQPEGFNVNGGFVVLPELLALTLGLSIYNSTFLAEIFRAGILSVPRGQIEAAASVGLTGARRALLIVLPQALRLALPPMAGQYQTLAKASSLAAAIGYPDIMQIVGGTILSQSSQALEAMLLVVLLYGAINLSIALAMNTVNRRLRSKGMQR